jgi:uncharacterized membrane protein YeaQ/YmgE (transglycosylase-associated protein family)
MVRSWMISLALAGSFLAWGGEQAEESPNAPAAASAELHRMLDQVRAGKAESQKAWLKLEASTHVVQAAAAGASGDFATQWMKTVASGGPENAPFYAGTEKILQSWIAAIEGGSNRFPPMQEIRGSMGAWQDQNASLLNALQTVAEAEKKWRVAEFKEIPRMKPESVAGVYAKEEQSQRDLTIRKLLADAGSIMGAPGGLPSPLASTDRAGSPFNGPANPGVPDRLWIYLGKASTRIGESIPVEIGLGNSRGPNALADQDYSVRISCQGCAAKNSEYTIVKGERSVRTDLQMKEAQASITAQSGKISPATLEAYGCVPASDVNLTLEKDKAEGPADGATPIWFRFAFRDAKGQLATDFRRKTILAQYVGVGERVLPSQLYRSVAAGKSGIELGADECVSPQSAVSAVVGVAKVSAATEVKQVAPLELKFDYAFPLLDEACIALGILFGFLANFSMMKNRHLNVIVGWLVSAAGAAILLWVGYAYYLNTTPVPDTWIIVLALATVGGVVGVCATKLFTPENVEPLPNYEDSPDSD